MLGANGVLLLTLLLYAAIIYGVVRLIKYLIRYGIDYYFKKLDARQTEHRRMTRRGDPAAIIGGFYL